MAGWLKTFFSGMCVGAADIVPGISGGTVAFIIGIYEELLRSIGTINARSLSYLGKLQFRRFFEAVSWRFLLAFLLGVGCSFLTLAKGFTLLLNHEVYRCYLYSAFMGLIVGSVFFCAKLLSSFQLKTGLSCICGVAIAWFLSSTDLTGSKGDFLYDVPLKQEWRPQSTCVNYDPDSSMLLNISQSQLSVMLAKKYLSTEDLVYSQQSDSYIYAGSVIQSSAFSFINVKILIGGMLAVSAMLLPGISGSYILTILGLYGVVLGALVDLIEGLKAGMFDLASFRIVLSMGIGIAIGAICFSRVVSFLLNRFRDLTIACLIGFMLGAIKAVWPFWSYAYELSPMHLGNGLVLKVVDPILPQDISVDIVISGLFFIVGIAAVFIIETIATRATKQDPKDTQDTQDPLRGLDTGKC